MHRTRAPGWAPEILAFQAASGGEGGIRTRGGVAPTHAFQACSFGLSDTSPQPAASQSKSWRRGRDSNPWTSEKVSGFRDRPDRPLRHLSVRAPYSTMTCGFWQRTPVAAPGSPRRAGRHGGRAAVRASGPRRARPPCRTPRAAGPRHPRSGDRGGPAGTRRRTLGTARGSRTWSPRTAASRRSARRQPGARAAQRAQSGRGIPPGGFLPAR